MKKISIFIPSLEFGGAERVTSYIANYLSGQNYEVSLFTTRTGTKEYVIDKSVHRIISNNTKEIYNSLKEFKPDLAIVVFAPQIISLYRVLKKLRIKWITSERNDPNNFAGKRITKACYQYLLTKADGVVFQTSQAQNYYKGKIRGLEKIIYNPLDLTRFPDSQNIDKRKVIINVGRLHPQKNQSLLISAFKSIHEKHPEYKLEIYGEGKLRTALQAQINEMNLSDAIELMGSRPDVLECVESSEIFVLTSDFEGMPNALIEAMALGVPVISTDCPCGGPRELIKDHKNGTLIPVGDEEKLVNSIEELILSAELRDYYSREEVKIRELLNMDKIMHEWEDMIDDILGDKK